MKYSVTFIVEIEVEADSSTEAEQVARELADWRGAYTDVEQIKTELRLVK